MVILDSIPSLLRGRGHNECVPFKCDCGAQFLFGLSDGVISDGDLDQPTVRVQCPDCNAIAQIDSDKLRKASKNGQAR